jgi:hypothetical protein
LSLDIENMVKLVFNLDMTIGTASRSFSVWTGLLYDMQQAVRDFYYYRDEIRADQLWKAIAPVQLWSLYYALKSYTGQTPKLVEIGAEQLPEGISGFTGKYPIPLPQIEESGYVEPGEIRSPTKEGALFVRTDEDPTTRGYKFLLKAIGGRLPEESAAGEAYERYGPRGDVVQAFLKGANRARSQWMQFYHQGRFAEANDIASMAAAKYGLDADDFQREEDQWQLTLLERAAKQIPTQLRPAVHPELERVQPGLQLPSPRQRKAAH